MLQDIKEIIIPGSKSYTNRALILASLKPGPVRLDFPLFSDDTEAMIDCLTKVGIWIERGKDFLIVHGDILQVPEQRVSLFAKDSGTTLRFLLPFLSIAPGIQIIDGGASLRRRPIRDLVEALCRQGAKIRYLEKEGSLPLSIESSFLQSGTIAFSPKVSSQFYSAIFLIQGYLEKKEQVFLRLEKPLPSMGSLPYIEMTLKMISDFEKNGGRYPIEGDYSSAAYFFAMAALMKVGIHIKNLDPDSLQADRRFLQILEEMGNEVLWKEDGITFIGKKVAATSCCMKDCPDQIMTLAVLASFVDQVTKISGISSLRVKECDRLFAVCNELQKMGIRTEVEGDSLLIFGGSPKEAVIETYQDHRIAMSFAVAKKKLPGLKIQDPHVVQKTFPTFWQEWEKL